MEAEHFDASSGAGAPESDAEPERFDVLVLGGGSGLTAAYYAEQDGKSVALVDERPGALGGTCVNRGCIPSKGLIQAAEVLKTIREAGRFGIHLPQDQVRVDFKALTDQVRERRSKGAEGTRGWVDSSFTPFYGHARFVAERTVEVQTEDGPRRVSGGKVFIATGARPAVPPIPGLKDIPYHTNETIFDIEEQPGSIVILGGGYIGVEFGHFFSTLGTDTTVIESLSCLLREDDDVRSVFTKNFQAKENVTLLNGTRAVQAIQEDGRVGFLVRKKDSDDEPTRVLADAVLVAVGRVPNTDRLDLDAAGVETDERGWIRVDDHLRTTHPDVYAYGDVIGQGMFKHTSSKEGLVAYRNSQGGDRVMDYTANPHAIFSDPQIGSVGLTEAEAREQGLDVTVVKKDYDGVMKGQIVGSPPGLAKLLVEKGTDRILGFHLVGPHAADLVHEVVVAMENGLPAQAVRDAIHIHPTMPELIHTVFEATG